jgi:hypothetical protein
MNTAQATTEAEIRAQVDSWLHAVLMDIEAIMSHYASDILAFDAVSQLPFRAWMHTEGTGKRVWPCVVQHDDFRDARRGRHGRRRRSVCHGTHPLRRHRRERRSKDWLAAHDCGVSQTARHMDDCAEHFSAPFDMETLKVLDVQP